MYIHTKTSTITVAKSQYKCSNFKIIYPRSIQKEPYSSVASRRTNKYLMCVCMVRADSQPCLVSLRYARKMKLSGGSTFMPKCRHDGSYAPVQCHRESGCWCVTSQGKSVPNTSVRNGRPKCRRGIV